jgi:hypothetical protein
MSRRQVYAFVALADLPPLECVLFTGGDGLHVDVGDNVDPTRWLQLLGADPAQVRRQRYDNDEPARHGFILAASFEWRGWRMHVRGFIDDGQPDPMDPLDEQTVEQLQAVAAGDPPSAAFVRGNALLAVDPGCGRCLRPFDPDDKDPAGAARCGESKFCRGCVDRCHESTDAFHECAVCG